MMRYLVIAVSALAAACSPSPPAEEGETLQAELTSPVEVAEEASADAAPALDPAALDLSGIALAMRIPAVFDAREEGALLFINVTNPRLDVNIAEEFPLRQTSDVQSAFLDGEAREGFRIWTYATRPEDAPALQAISGELARLKAEAPGENELSFGAIAPGCWNEPSQTATSLKRTLYLRVSPETDFQLFIPEQELTKESMRDTDNFWAPCNE